MNGREESATSAQLKEHNGNHAGTAQPRSEQAGDGLGLSGDSASPSFPYALSLTWHATPREHRPAASLSDL